MILSLSMLKMEKNFVAVINKDYPRKPYQEYLISNRDDKWNTLIGFVEREWDELNVALRILEAHKRSQTRGIEFIDDEMIIEQVYKSMKEVADVSNALDYLFEGLLKAYLSLEKSLK